MALNESVVNRVRVGMKTKIRFEALPDIELDGEVVSISQFPAAPGRDGEDFRYFLSRVKINKSAPGLTPGMTTRIDVLLAGRRNVVAVPLQAIRSLAGKKICYVVHERSLEPRAVELGQDTTSMVEIKSGLKAGELVALDPPTADSNVESFSKSADQTKERTAAPDKVASSRQ